MTRITNTETALTYLNENGIPFVRQEGDSLIIEWVCSRCHVTGHYAFNLKDGTKCFGCTARGGIPKGLKRVDAKEYAQSEKRRINSAAKRKEKRQADHQAWLEGQRDENEKRGLGRITHGERAELWATEREERIAKLQAERKERARYLGTEGEKLTVEVEVKKLITIEGRFGYQKTISRLAILETADGASVKWFGSGAKVWDLKEGQSIEITGRVKDHSEYEGVKQTGLTRCKFTVTKEAPEGD